MISVLRTRGLDNCLLAGSSMELFRNRTECNFIDGFDVSQNCQQILNVVSTTTVSRNSWILIANMVLGTARIYKIQVDSVYDKAMVLSISRPSFCLASVQRTTTRSLISSVSESTYQRRRKISKPTVSHKRPNSKLKLYRVEPTQGRYDFSDPEFISDFLSIHEETPEENLGAQIAAPDRLTTCNSLISLKETIPVRVQALDDDDFGQASYQEFEEFLTVCDERHTGERRVAMTVTQVRVEVHSSSNSSLRGSNATLPDDENSATRRHTWNRMVTQENINEISPADVLPAIDDVHLTSTEFMPYSPVGSTPRRSTLDVAVNQAKRRRIWEDIIIQANVNEILPADDLPTNFDVQLMSPKLIPASEPEYLRNKRRRVNATLADAGVEANRKRVMDNNYIHEILPANDPQADVDVYVMSPESLPGSEPKCSRNKRRRQNFMLADAGTIPDSAPTPKRRILNSTLADAENLVKRRRIWPNNTSQADNNEILSADDFLVATNETNSTNVGIPLTPDESMSDSVIEPTPVLETQSIQRFKTSQRLFRDLNTELQMPVNFTDLDVYSSTRRPDFTINIPRKLYNPWERNIIYTIPDISKTSSTNLGMVRPVMAECILSQYQRNLKTTKKLKEKTLNPMTLVDDFFNKKPIEPEHLSYDVNRSQPQQITTIAELDASLEQSQLSSESIYPRSEYTVITNVRTMSNTTSTDMSRTSSRTMSSFRCVSEQEPPGSVASTQITDKTIMPAADTHFFISDITSDRFVDELNIEDSPLELRTKTQNEWGPSGLLKKLWHLWNTNCDNIDMKLLCRGASRKCAATAFSSLLVLQSAKLQYVVLDKVDGANTIKNIRRSDTLDSLFREYLEI